MLFLSLGSNYDFRQAWRHALTFGRKSHSENLQRLLNDRYAGSKTMLYSKGRGALAAAIRLATGGSGKVAVTSLTCYSVVEAVESTGCEVVYVESSPAQLQFDHKTLEKTMNQHDIKAVIIQNMLGIPVNIDAVVKLARQHNAAIIEDLAHSVGGKYLDGREIGTVGDYTMLSFGRDKMLDTINGGALVVRAGNVDKTLQPPLESPGFIQQLRDRVYPPIGHLARVLFPVGLGKYVLAISYKLRLAVRSADGGADVNLRLPHWQAKLALGQFMKLDEKLKTRLGNQEAYLAKLSDFSPATSSNAVRLALLIKNRDEVVEALKSEGYFTEDIWYDTPVSPKRLAHLVRFPSQDFPNATKISEHIINLPTHQLVNAGDIDRISKIILDKAEPWK